jgi:hypothetical protein
MALQVGLHENPDAMSHRIAIGTATAFRGGYAYHYKLHVLADQENKCLYVCDTPTDTGLIDEKMFIIFDGGYWYACEGKVADDRFDVRQACHRTLAPFWQEGWHVWEVNTSRHDQPDRQYANGEWTLGTWRGELVCETRHEQVSEAL